MNFFEHNDTTTTRNERTMTPLVNIHETADRFILEAEMPGLDRGNINLELTGDELTITGARKETGIPEGYTVVHRERSPFEYARTFTLGREVARDSIEAHYENGVLTVTIPKSREQQPRKIEIKN